MTEPYDDVQLPDSIEQGAQGGPNFSTNIIELSSGREQRNRNWKYAKATYVIGYGTQYLDDDIYNVRDFFNARSGRWRSFAFKDFLDYSVTGQAIGVGDGTATEFYLVKSYTSGPTTYTRPISRPLSATLKIYFDDVEQASGWTLGALGLITFDTAPDADVVITSDFEFNVPVRFDTDTFSATLETFEAGEIPNLPLKEVLERDT
jgi:uncharacterized protein (TIGR02217 family)